MLGLGVDPHAGLLGEIDDFLEGGDLVDAVERRVGGAEVGQALHSPQRLQLGQREVVGEPARRGGAVDRLGGLAARELGMAGHVSGAGDVGLVAGDELMVLRRHEIGLDEVGAEFDGQPI
jgi:hypothetical protein